MLAIDNKKLFQCIAMLCFAYFFVELGLISYVEFSRDEFWFAHHIYQYLHHLPYRDFLPYKPVVGWYLLTLPMAFSHDVLHPLFYIKDEIALINTLMIGLVAYWSTRFFHTKAILLTIPLILFGQQFFVISTELRVDMLSCWFALISVLLLISNRSILAGIMIGISFLVSQKTAWFWLATNGALGICWFIQSRNNQIFQKILFTNIACFLIIGLYIGIWSYLSSPAIVLHSVFYEAYTQSTLTWYVSALPVEWQLILSNGPLLIMLWPLTWIALASTPKQDPVFEKRLFITLYTSLIMLCVITCKQQFIYNMVFLFPALFLMYSDFMSWFLDQKKNKSLAANPRAVVGLCVLNTLLIIAFMIAFNPTPAYWMIALLPTLIGTLLVSTENDIKKPTSILIIITVLFTGFIYPTLGLFKNLAQINNSYQKQMIRLSNQLAKTGGDYLAGTPFLYPFNQTILGLRNLIGPAIDYLYHPSATLLPAMIPSLYLDKLTKEEVIQQLKLNHLKFYVNNERIIALPNEIKKQLDNEFEHFWGSIYLYAPTIQPHSQKMVIKFDGKYQVESISKNIISIDHQKVTPGARLSLHHGEHLSNATNVYRLKLVPESIDLGPYRHQQKDEWYNLIKQVLM